MKLSRILATGAALALVAGSTLIVGGSASAAGTDNYVTAPLPAEQSPYAAGWFAGTVAPGGSATSTSSGLSLVGPYQILDGTTPTTGLVSLVAGAKLNIVSGEAAFQIPLFSNAGGPDTGFTTLVPTIQGDAGLHSTNSPSWSTTGAIKDSAGVTIFAAGAESTLPLFEAALASTGSATPYRILAFGAYLPAGKTAVISSITWGGNTNWFLPAPTAVVTPTSIATTDTATAGKGISGIFTGFVPGETVEVYLGTDNGGGPIPGTFVADTDGRVTASYVSATKIEPGNYYFGVNAPVSGVNISAAFTVVADPAVLAATGANATPIAITGGVLLLLGAGFGAMAIRRRKLVNA